MYISFCTALYSTFFCVTFSRLVCVIHFIIKFYEKVKEGNSEKKDETMNEKIKIITYFLN